jgi:hypothetical protein
VLQACTAEVVIEGCASGNPDAEAAMKAAIPQGRLICMMCCLAGTHTHSHS